MAIRNKLFPYHSLNLEQLPESLTSNITDVKQLFEKYQELERHAVLELAAWKAVTFIVSYDEKDGIVGALEFIGGGWKAHKKETRRCKEVTVLVRCIRKFRPPLPKVP